MTGEGGRPTYKPVNPLRAAEWAVVPVQLATARRLVEQHHYARGGSNTAVATHGLQHRASGEILGVAWWLPPTKAAALAFWPDHRAVLSLTRLVICPDVPTNAASFLLMRSVRLLDARWRCLVTWADTAQGHTGGIYVAAGWEPLGLSQPTDAWSLNGVQIARKSAGHSRTRAEMRELGAVFLGYFTKHRFRLVRRRVARSQPALRLECAS